MIILSCAKASMTEEPDALCGVRHYVAPSL